MKIIEKLNDVLKTDGIAFGHLSSLSRTMYRMGKNPLSLIRTYLTAYGLSINIQYTETNDSDISINTLRRKTTNRMKPLILVVVQKEKGFVNTVKMYYVTDEEITEEELAENHYKYINIL